MIKNRRLLLWKLLFDQISKNCLNDKCDKYDKLLKNLIF